MNLVNDIFGTNLNGGVQLAIIFAVLLVVLLLVVWLIRLVFGNNVSRIAKNRQPRLAVTDAAVVDDKRRLVLVRRDDVEHLILIGGNSDVLVEGNISRVKPVQVPMSDQTTLSEKPKESPLPQKTSIDERPSKIRSKPFATPFATVADGAEKVGIKSAAGLTAIGAGTIAAATKAGDVTSNIGSSVAESTSDVAENAASSVAEVSDSIASDATSAANLVKDNAIEKASDVAKSATETGHGSENETAVKPLSEEVVEHSKDDADADKKIEFNSANESTKERAVEKSDAEIDLEKALGDDEFETSDPANEDMQKILDELTADIK